jgi:sugar lactone lactonase YvrE
VGRLGPGHPPTVVATGFTNIIDITFDRRGRLVILEMARNGLESGDPTGALVRIEKNGTQTELASAGLITPTSVAYGPDGAYYVANKGIGVGEVVRIPVGR